MTNGNSPGRGLNELRDCGLVQPMSCTYRPVMRLGPGLDEAVATRRPRQTRRAAPWTAGLSNASHLSPSAILKLRSLSQPKENPEAGRSYPSDSRMETN